MSWLYSFTLTEGILSGLFALLYLAYIGRVVSTAKKLKVGYSKVLIKLLVRTVYFILIIVAILGPSFGESKREVKSVGKDIFMLVDLSESMNAADIQPTRLEKIKFELKNIVKAFNSDRMGIIIFSSESFMQSPLTYDQNALNLFIETLNTRLVPNAGTDFGPPLRMALEKLNAEESPLTQQKSKVIILISDGEDFGEQTEDVTQEIESQGIKMFTLGIGTERGSKIRVRGGYKRDRQGNEVITKLDSKSLRKLASETDGQYFEINETNNDVSRLISTINKIEGELRDTRQVDVSANRYYYFLLAALFLILLDVLASIKVIKI
ncbi:vWA domain-containing protein [Fulvivirga lutimaris]|uniref:vWA domain-containing protein n=1 Tax=Fulvivirga lutimaris TaxID=1819566 RepID=UPI0012BCCE38|nr:VWA domain-containing protein [Fulvivirga lutimaris]MTI40421.1 VWA domain-containing protein [Fulvivirga lutimaris]